MDDRKLTIPLQELLKVFSYQQEKLEGIRQCCMLMAEQGIADKTEGVEVVNDIATAMLEEIQSLVDGLNTFRPEAEGTCHIIAVDPNNIYH